MASSSDFQRSLKEKIKCKICNQQITNPRTLQCDHSFCKECLEDKIIFSKNAVNKILCPVCKSDHLLQDGETVSDLKPKDHIIQVLKLLNPVPRKKTTSDEFQCSQPGCSSNIELYCTSCLCFNCGFCGNHHHKHADGILKAVAYSKRSGSYECYCLTHKCFARYICAGCSDIICVYCKSAQHDEHSTTHVDYFEESLPIMQLNSHLATTESSLRQVKNNVFVSCSELEDDGVKLKKIMSSKKIMLLNRYLEYLNEEEKNILLEYEEKLNIYKYDRDSLVKVIDEQLLTNPNNKKEKEINKIVNTGYLDAVYGQLNDAMKLMKHLEQNQKLLDRINAFKGLKLNISMQERVEWNVEKPYGDVTFASYLINVGGGNDSTLNNVNFEDLSSEMENLKKNILIIENDLRGKRIIKNQNECKEIITRTESNEIDLESSLQVFELIRYRRESYLKELAESEEGNDDNKYDKNILKQSLLEMDKLSKQFEKGIYVSREDIPPSLKVSRNKNCPEDNRKEVADSPDVLPRVSKSRYYAFKRKSHESVRKMLPNNFPKFTPQNKKLILERRQLQYIMQGTILKQKGLKEEGRLFCAESKKCKRLLESGKKIELEDVQPIATLKLWRPPQNVQGLLEQVGIALNQGFKKIQTEMSLVVKGEDKSIVQMYEEMADQHQDLLKKVDAIIDTDFVDPMLSLGYRPTHMQVMLSHDDASNPLYGTARSLQRSTSSA